MHIPDGFLSPPVWLSLDAISLPVIGWMARRARPQPNGPTPPLGLPLPGLMGAFVFAAQMVNVPVGFGASGHLLGGSLLAVVLGPTPAALTMTAVVILQALLLQDGGVLALGANIFNMAIAGVTAGYLPARVWGRRAIPLFLGGALSVLTSAALVLGQLSLSGATLTARPLAIACALFAFTAALEGAITVAAVRAIERLSPRNLPADVRVSVSARTAIACAALLLATGGAWISSTAPDSLQRLAADIGLGR